MTMSRPSTAVGSTDGSGLWVQAPPGTATALLASRCLVCRRTAFPACSPCLACAGPTVEAKLVGPARLDYLTDITVAPPGALIEPPYRVGVARFDDFGLAVIGLVSGAAARNSTVEPFVYEYRPGSMTFGFREIAEAERMTR